jgi:triacylglycerol lipase
VSAARRPDGRLDRRLTPVEGGWLGRPFAEMRSTLEASRLVMDPVMYGAGVPRGDGRPVLVLPGFLAGDESLWLLRAWLRRIGYQPVTCGFRFNVDCGNRALERVERHAQDAHDRTGRRVAVIGHSRGGHFARALAARRPDLVSHAISLGADLQGMFGISAPTRAAVGLVRQTAAATGLTPEPACYRSRCTCGFVQAFGAEFPVDDVHLTSVYSKGDGVVRWQRAIVDEAENVEITGSHVGLASNRKAFRVIGEALARPERAGADRH